MMDDRTGSLMEIPDEVIKNIPKKDFKQRIADLMRDPGFRERVESGMCIPAEKQGPVFEIDEIVELKDRRFRVRGFEGGLLHLEGLPHRAAQEGAE